MTLRAQSSALVILMLVLLLIKIEGSSTPKEVHENGSGVSPSSPALMEKDDNEIIGCEGRPEVCSRGEFPPRSLCCGNRCVDVTSDRDNCGLCEIRCLFTFQCCNRLCINTNLDIFNCGMCGRACAAGRPCILGICAFQQTGPLPVPVSVPEPLSQSPQFPPQPPKMD
ncbi:hypothetical protein VNO78_31984 [Psophocarpus tetragonolobus]|uniref:Stigma-specific Stig1 family protein n=1 Tax=Psophocarpus tetragonolobus TaxID=3891 RepID=A0AAN9RZ34_PSOTE